MYLIWFDADRKKSSAEKIAAGHARFLARFGHAPTVCLLNPEDVTEGAPLALRPLPYIDRNCFYIGVDDQEAIPPPDEPQPETRLATPTPHSEEATPVRRVRKSASKRASATPAATTQRRINRARAA